MLPIWLSSEFPRTPAYLADEFGLLISSSHNTNWQRCNRFPLLAILCFLVGLFIFSSSAVCVEVSVLATVYTQTIDCWLEWEERRAGAGGCGASVNVLTRARVCAQRPAWRSTVPVCLSKVRLPSIMTHSVCRRQTICEVFSAWRLVRNHKLHF